MGCKRWHGGTGTWAKTGQKGRQKRPFGVSRRRVRLPEGGTIEKPGPTPKKGEGGKWNSQKGRPAWGGKTKKDRRRRSPRMHGWLLPEGKKTQKNTPTSQRRLAWEKKSSGSPLHAGNSQQVKRGIQHHGEIWKGKSGYDCGKPTGKT